MIRTNRSLVVALLGIPSLVALNGCSGDSKSASSTTTPPPAVVTAGSYVFSVAGTDASDGDYYVVGSFVADGNGNITSATADYNLGSGIDKDVPLTGTYSVSGTTASVTLTSLDKSFSDTFNTTLGQVSAAVTNFDGTGTGNIFQQTTSGFAPAGNYAYTVQGESDGTVTGSGSVVANATGNITSGSSTLTDGSTTLTASSATGFFYNPQSDGRGQASLQGIDLAYYVVSPTRILAIGLDDRALLLIQATKS